MRSKAEQFLARLPEYPEVRFAGRGVVIAGGGEKYFASLYVVVRALRHVGCTLPIQVWYLGRHNEMPPERQAVLAPWNVECIDADVVRQAWPAQILNGWELKVYATLNSSFQEVLFLDADCYPVRNPEVLFDVADYRDAGAIFWPDSEEIDQRLKWRAFAVLGPRRLGSVESGQFVLDKRKCWRALNLAWFYNDHSDFYYQYCYGDKHTFEVAWNACEIPYVMFTTKPRVEYVGYLHIGPDHETLFVHRCSDKFRIEYQTYVTPQRQGITSFHPSLPLEEECWRWLAELTTQLALPLRSPDGRVQTPFRSRNAQITLATLYTPQIADYGVISAEVVRRYAQRHGYGAVVHTEPVDPARPPSWSKLGILEKIFASDSECKWVMWIDADAIILRPEVALTEFLDEDFDLIVADDSPQSSFNGGVFFARNDPAVQELFRRAYAKVEYTYHHFWEQAAVQEVLREGVAGLRVKIVPRHRFNAFADEYNQTSFLAHFAGQSHEKRVREITRLAGKVWFPMPRNFRPGTNDEWIFAEVAGRNEYRLPPSLANKIVLDVGGHIGSFAYACAIRGASEVWSVEAHPENFAILRQNLAEMEMPGLRTAIFGAAWGNSAPLQSLRVHYGDGINRGGRCLTFGDGSETNLLAFDDLVRQITRDGQRRIDVLKLDCEAAEFPILYTSQTLPWIDQIFAEIHPWVAGVPEFQVPGFSNDDVGLRNHLEAQGFRVRIEAYHLWAWRESL